MPPSFGIKNKLCLYMAFPINTYLYILFNYHLTENLRPSHTTVKSVNISTLFLDMFSPSERVHIVSSVYDNFPTQISGKERTPVEITAWPFSPKLTWHGPGVTCRRSDIPGSVTKTVWISTGVLQSKSLMKCQNIHCPECDVFTIAIK